MKSVEHGIRNPKSPAGKNNQKKSVAYGIRKADSDFEKRACEVNTPPSNANYIAKGPKMDSKSPTFKKFK